MRLVAVAQETILWKDKCIFRRGKGTVSRLGCRRLLCSAYAVEQQSTQIIRQVRPRRHIYTIVQSGRRLCGLELRLRDIEDSTPDPRAEDSAMRRWVEQEDECRMIGEGVEPPLVWVFQLQQLLRPLPIRLLERETYVEV